MGQREFEEKLAAAERSSARDKCLELLHYVRKEKLRESQAVASVGKLLVTKHSWGLGDEYVSEGSTDQVPGQLPRGAARGHAAGAARGVRQGPGAVRRAVGGQPGQCTGAQAQDCGAQGAKEDSGRDHGTERVPAELRHGPGRVGGVGRDVSVDGRVSLRSLLLRGAGAAEPHGRHLAQPSGGHLLDYWGPGQPADGRKHYAHSIELNKKQNLRAYFALVTCTKAIAAQRGYRADQDDDGMNERLQKFASTLSRTFTRRIRLLTSLRSVSNVLNHESMSLCNLTAS
ncbi:hypothetical protein GQ600_3703 [Phytophthora cactorum]|nr:hypothetical protein GQ600_3703 [Phytophthora cactorum]